MDERGAADDTGAASDSGRREEDVRHAELERRRRSVDELTRFQIEAYKARLAALKRAEARHLAEKESLRRQFADLQRRHDALARELAGRDGARDTEDER